MVKQKFEVATKIGRGKTVDIIMNVNAEVHRVHLSLLSGGGIGS